MTRRTLAAATLSAVVLTGCATMPPAEEIAAGACERLRDGNDLETVSRWIIRQADEQGVSDYVVLEAMKEECPIVLAVIAENS